MRKKRILFISRKYPPSIGGMQTYTKNLLSGLRDFYEIDPILLSRNQAHILWFLPYAIFKAAFLCLTRAYDYLYICDASLAPVGLLLKKLFKVRVIVTVHGLDITWGNVFYQGPVVFALSRMDKIICVSSNTREECVKRKVPPGICAVIPNGVSDDYYINLSKDECRKKAAFKLKMNFNNKIVLLTAGRLIRRKGIDWFIKAIFPKLGNDFLYAICGEGPLRTEIEKAINGSVFGDRIFLLGKIELDTLRLLYGGADVFVMPNQKVKNDPEGFGIVAIEAASCGLPVVANAVDGISEAVLNGRTGWLIGPDDPRGFIEKIKNPGLVRSDVRSEALKTFSWCNISRRYRDTLEMT